MWRFLFLSCLISSTVHGQSAIAAAKDAKGALQVRLLCVDTVPGAAEVVVPDADQAGGMAQITLARAEGNELAVFCDTRWPAKTEYRRFLLLISRQDGSIHPFVLPEYPPFR